MDLPALVYEGVAILLTLAVDSPITWECLHKECKPMEILDFNTNDVFYGSNTTESHIGAINPILLYTPLHGKRRYFPALLLPVYLLRVP